MKFLYEASGIRIALLKIRSGQAGGLEAALQVLTRGNIDVGLFQDKKVTLSGKQ